jgi:hypothetical protein
MTELREHPDFEQLLEFLDQAMSNRSSREVEKHIAECWKCHAQIYEIQSTIREFSRYHEKVLLPNLPPPPAPWKDLRAAMARIDEADPEPVRLLPKLGSFARLVLGGGAVACVVLALTLTFGTGGASKKPVASAVVVPSIPKESPVVELTPTPHHIAAPVYSVANDEVLAIAALHRIGADLGDPVRATVEGGKVSVTGIGLTPAREVEIRDALASIPGVQINFQEGHSVGGSSRSVSVVAGRSPFEARLLLWAGGQEAWEQYADRVLDESDAILARSHALRNLALEFPDARRAELNPSAAAQLSEIAASHRAALDRHAAAIEALLAPVREALNAPAAVTPQAGRDLLAAAQRLDRVLSVVFGGAATDLTPTQLLAELSDASAGISK